MAAPAYVVNQLSNNVTPIDVATNTAGTPIPAGDSPVGIAITPDGTTAYVVGDSVAPINLATNTAGTPIPVGSSPQRIAIAPDGRTDRRRDEHRRSFHPCR
jgi:YVTN family beta-propeller protein